jgi:hypothetical protein
VWKIGLTKFILRSDGVFVGKRSEEKDAKIKFTHLTRVTSCNGNFVEFAIGKQLIHNFTRSYVLTLCLQTYIFVCNRPAIISHGAILVKNNYILFDYIAVLSLRVSIIWAG